MNIVECLAPLSGSWQGRNLMRFMPTDEYQESGSTATVKATARDFVTLEYTWSYEGQPQNGLLLLGSGPKADVGPTSDGTGASGARPSENHVEAVWVDSFHSTPTWLTLSGTVDDDGVVRLTGSYPAPEGPDWGWQIHIDPGDGNGGRMTMHNVVPGYDPYQAVEATYLRKA